MIQSSTRPGLALGAAGLPNDPGSGPSRELSTMNRRQFLRPPPSCSDEPHRAGFEQAEVDDLKKRRYRSTA